MWNLSEIMKEKVYIFIQQDGHLLFYLFSVYGVNSQAATQIENPL